MTTPETEPTYEHIRIEHEENLSWIVFDRPGAANALSNELLGEFSAALEYLKTHGGPVLAIRGEGKGFSAGYDISAPKQLDPVADRDRLQRNLHRYVAIWDHPKPVIAAVHGYAIAGATQLIIFTDITIVAEDAKLGEPTVPIGGGFIAPLWAILAGPKRAKELAFVPGNYIDGKTAVEWGLANHAVPADEVIEATRSLASRMALVSPDLLHMKKVSINRAMEWMGMRQAIEGTAEIDALLHLVPDVIALRTRVREEGLKVIIDEFRVPPTSDISKRKA
ncbi:enoyl-CoA hydratase-related protein [Microbacterium sp. KHB019]|uniref:enoyl-CoA hydratase-related protein n=1 Tax=Microbacterium sp. KHB019 TaxID=3129770 RepID=UPI003079048A